MTRLELISYRVRVFFLACAAIALSAGIAAESAGAVSKMLTVTGAALGGR